VRLQLRRLIPRARARRKSRRAEARRDAAPVMTPRREMVAAAMEVLRALGPDFE
jgi:hypothetical protein